MEIFAERVRDLATALRFNAASLGKAVGVSSSSAALYWSGKRTWPSEVLPDLASTLCTTVDYLLGRTEDPGVLEFRGSPSDFDELVAMSREKGGATSLTTPGDHTERKQTSASRSSDSRAVTDDAALVERFGLKMIPEVDVAYGMGGGTFSDEYVEERFVPFRSDWLDRIARGRPADFALVHGIGDSMFPTILDDDDVLLNRAERTIRQQDQIWALAYGQLGMIKRVRRLPSGQFQLNSDNPAVTTIEASEEELHIVGRVTWIGRRV